MSLPIVFSADPAFNQLDQEGRVASFRTSKKELGPVWVRRSRTGPKEFDAEIVERRKIEHSEELQDLAGISGFDSLEAWVSKIEDYHGSFKTGYVYIIEKAEKGEA